MKAATKVTLRRTARGREAEELCAVRVQVQDVDELPTVPAQAALTVTDVRFEGQQPLSGAARRRQAADRWWREACLALSDPGVKRYH